MRPRGHSGREQMGSHMTKKKMNLIYIQTSLLEYIQPRLKESNIIKPDFFPLDSLLIKKMSKED